MLSGQNSSLLCGLVLAAGEGTRLRSFIHRVRGDDLPKQFVNLVGTRSMLEHTFARAERIIPRERLFTVIGRHHLRYPEVRRQLSSRAPGTVIVQPANRETGPGILLPLVHLSRRFPDAIVAMFPSDHFILEENRFMGYVSVACDAVSRDSASLILLAVVPERPEPQYGYVVPEKISGPALPEGIARVVGFIEKPSATAAEILVGTGGLWNTLVMVFRARALLELYARLCPALDRVFRAIDAAIGTAAEQRVLDEGYRKLPAINFSRDLLEAAVRNEPGRLRVLPVRDVCWSDWGSEERVRELVRRIRRQLAVNATGVFRPSPMIRPIRSHSTTRSTKFN